MKKNSTASIQEVLTNAGKAVSELADDVVTAAEPKVTAVAKEVSKKAGPMLDKAKKAGKDAVSAVMPEVYVQVNGKEYICTNVVERAKADYKATHKNVIRSCKVYIKPEDGCAYYVINQLGGKIDL